jgi:hypothetical protein
MDTAKAVTTAATDSLLETIVREWEHHKLIMSMIRDILMYMVRVLVLVASFVASGLQWIAPQDKTYCKQQKKTPVYDTGLQLFRDFVVRRFAAMPLLLATAALTTSLSPQRHREQTPEEDPAGQRDQRAQRRDHRPRPDEELPVHVGGRQHQQRRRLPGGVREGLPRRDAQLLPARVAGVHVAKHRAGLSQKGLCVTARTVFAPRAHKLCPAQIENRIRQEEARADSYLDKSTKPKLRSVVQEELITKYAKRLVDVRAFFAAFPFF